MNAVRTAFVSERAFPGITGALLGTIAFALLISLGGFVAIPLPFTPVPITLQVLFVLLAGLMLGKHFGTFSVLLYITAGIAGCPIFAGAVGGVARIGGPTGGYLLGFLIAPCIVELIYEKCARSFFALIASLFAGLLIIYCCGIMHLAMLLRIPYSKAFLLGVYPFLIGDILKIILVLSAVQLTRRSSWNLPDYFQK